VKFLLDTNILSETSKPVPDPGVVAWLKSYQHESGLSVLALAEMTSGVEALPDGKRKKELLRKLQFLQEDYADAILPVDAVVAWEWGRYRRRVNDSGLQVAVIDSLIAATALSHGLTVVTRNTSDFPLVSVINPFASP
jgi:predicted nucleic acid-binding protein